jgi:hypothetical protein
MEGGEEDISRHHHLQVLSLLTCSILNHQAI